MKRRSSPGADRWSLLGRGLASALLALITAPVFGSEAVRITEVSYHPSGDELLEFVELHNSGLADVDLLGWSFVEGIRYGFGRSVVVPAGGVVVVARDRRALLRAYAIDPDRVVGEFSGALDNGGERLALVDGERRFREELRFRDDFPFDRAADGRGMSLHLACLEAPTSAPRNWIARAPSPGRYDGGADCELPAPAPDIGRYPIIINEIHYHPPGEPDPPLEFIELYHRGTSAVDLSSWSFDEGVRFTFPDGARIEPGGYLVVAQDPDFLAERLALDRGLVFGPFEDGSRLSNSGERLRLLDARGEVQDLVSYDEDEDWPAFSDGLGGSLQRVNPLGPSNASGNWRGAPPVDPAPEESPWRSFRLEGFHDGSRFYFYLLGAGEVLLDGVRLEEAGGDGASYLTGGDFDGGLGEWSGTGNHEGSEVLPEGGFGDGGPCLLIRATDAGNGFQHAMRQRLAERPAEETPLVLTFHLKYVSGDSVVVARSSVGEPDGEFMFFEVDSRTGDRGGEITPLKPNRVGDGATPPSLRFLDREPLWPGPEDAVRIEARVDAGEPVEVVARYQVGDGGQIETLILNDAGLGGDTESGDGVWGGFLPPAPADSLVWFSLEATTASGQSTLWPRWKNPVPTTGYYVPPELIEPPDPVQLFYIFTPRALTDLSCGAGAYRDGALVDQTGRAYRNVGVKFRGETACNYPKRPLRVRFNKGDTYAGRTRLNFNAGWNDKSMLREQFGFDFFRDAGVAYSETHMARVHTNSGRFHGAYLAVEDPREDYLRRNRRRTDGGLYKARSAMLSGATNGYEPRNDAAPAHLEAIGEFATTLNRTNGEELIEFLSERLDVEGVIDYQAVQAIITDGDSVVKNWLLYYGRHELAEDGPPLVTCFPWDLDLSYGQMLLTTDVRHYNIHPLFQTRSYPFHDQGFHGILNALLERAPDDYYIKAFYGRIWRLLEQKFAPEILLPRVDEYSDATGDLVREDLQRWRRTWGSRGNDPDAWRRDFRVYVERRHAFLTEFLSTENRTTQGRTFRYVPAPRLRFTEIHYNPSDDEALEFVEIASAEDEEIDVSGWDIPALGYVFPDGVKVGPREVVLVARDPAALRAETDGLDAVKVLGPYPGRLSNSGAILRLRDSGEDGVSFPETIDIVVYDDEGEWPSRADGDGPSLELVGDVDNDAPRSWRAGWSPGTVARGNEPPVARFAASPEAGAAPLTVLLDASSSGDPEGDAIGFEWELPGGATDDRQLLVVSIGEPGEHRIGLRVTDSFGATHRAEVAIVVDGAESPVYRRGDTNADGDVNVSDPVQLLLFLFSGASAPSCLETADVDDSGEVAITDAVSLLNYLFGNGSAPVAPFRECGRDSTEDALTCEAYAPCER